MQIGFNAPTTGPLIEPDSLVRIVTEGELLGFDYITISDHIMVPRNLQSKYPYTGTGEFPAGASAAWLEQLTTTAYVAGLTCRLNACGPCPPCAWRSPSSNRGTRSAAR